MNDRKRAGTHPKWLNFGGEMGHKGASPLSTPWSSERASRGHAARRVTPPVRKVRPSGSFGVPPPLIKHYSAHQSAGAIIPALMHRIPSELRSQACLGESSTRMGDWEVLVLHPFLRTSPPVFQVFCSFFSYLFIFFGALSHPYRSLREIRELPGRMGPTVRVWPTERDERPKTGRNAPEMAEFWRRNGAQGGEPGCPRVELERASRGHAARRENSTRAQS
ncbi:UNVERIFIED_CONTAM: hypothetical protein Scaly_3084300 [Sesamum calycinum]|uniref:Uncharacterized protein n=1 Tax=Sesamum calycinum TaxID=2727403 RepID=A0AAW2JMV5_9LAMI